MRSAVNRITVRGTDGTERTFTLQGGNLVIGRDPACGICLQDSQVSWQHAVLNDAGGTCIIEDLGSSNGTFVGAARIQRQVLSAGEIVRIGPFEIALQMRAAPSPTSASEQTMFDMAAFRVAAPIVNRPAHEQTATQRKLRFTQLSESYRTANLRQEALAGLTVAALLVPQGMAYALLAGLPPAMGLYASTLPMIVYALAGSGRQTSVGPVTVDSLMLVLGLSTLATAGTASFIALAVLTTAMIGATQLAMGALRLGFLVNFLSYPVLAGFTSAIAVITVIGQLKHVLGVSEAQHPQLYQTAMDVVACGASEPDHGSDRTWLHLCPVGRAALGSHSSRRTGSRRRVHRSGLCIGPRWPRRERAGSSCRRLAASHCAGDTLERRSPADAAGSHHGARGFFTDDLRRQGAR